MKKLFAFAFALFFASALIAQPPAGPANKGDSFGDKISAKGAVSLEKMTKTLDKNTVFTGKIKGTVKEVCSNKGCWIKMELPDKTQMQVKFKDYGFFVPTALAGKTVVLNGKAEKKLVSVDELKHFAEDAKKSQEEIDAITQPETQVKFLATGVLVI
ncbi:MAG TPA: DUF4920 domain-containing protein [Niabella sp.]|jgi:hypothetical protein|nr:DUF4920 domain-containing protein [Chitinophagaceae bacterium]HRN46655.1 DUF4920 domain-containing protein [Niabella sp.]HUN04100.1 DUF4920 domain-containing protein [Niabella sp.]